MKSFFANWKTTAAGIAAVLGAASHIINGFVNGDWSMNSVTADLAAISAGIGLIFAKDGNVTGGNVRQSSQ